MGAARRSSAFMAALLLLAARPATAGDEGLTLSPPTADALQGLLRSLAEQQRPARYCAQECSSTLHLALGGSLAQGRLTFEQRGEVVSPEPALVSLFGTRPGARVWEARLGEGAGERVPLAWFQDRYVALLPPGPYRLRGELQVPAGAPLDLFVPGPVGLLELSLPDAQVLGDRRRRAVQAASFQLVPRVSPSPQAEAEAPASRLRFSLRRSFDLARDRRFEVAATVEGARPGQIVSLPLLPEEQVEGTEPEGASVRPQNAPRIEFTAQDSSAEFHYFGAWTGSQVELSAPEGAVRETWTVRCSDPFACTFEGDAEVLPGAKGHVWTPLPGQRLQVQWRELEPLAGVHALVQTVRLDSLPRGRNLRQSLAVSWSASASTLERLVLPTGAVVTDFRLGGEAVPVLRGADGAIALTLPAGRSDLQATWEILDGAGGPLHRPPVPRFAVPLGTLQQAFHPAEGRSVLLAGGLEGSPEVKLWPALATCALLALLLWLLLRRGLRPPRPTPLLLLLPAALGFAIFSPYAFLPLMAALALAHWMARGAAPRHGLRGVAEILALLGVALVALVVFFVVLHHAFFSDWPIEVVNFAQDFGGPQVQGASYHELRWTAGLAGSEGELPGIWALTVPTLAVRLLWFAWAILMGLLLYREGRGMVQAIVTHWGRSVFPPRPTREQAARPAAEPADAAPAAAGEQP